MPTYEYECTRCGHVSELFQSIKDAAKKKLHCEHCNAVTPVRRLIGTGGAVLFKGSGFYQTDYRSESYTKAAKAEKEAAGGPKPKDDAKTKPDTAASTTQKESTTQAAKE